MINNIDRLPFSNSIKNKLHFITTEILKFIKGEFKIILFGSYASATYNSRSDLDILILCENNLDRVSKGDLLYTAEENRIDLVFYTFDQFFTSQCRLVKEIKNNNVLLIGGNTCQI